MVSIFGISRERVWEARNHAVPMSHTGLVQPQPPGARKCDTQPLCAPHNADLTFAKIAGSMDGSPSQGGDL